MLGNSKLKWLLLLKNLITTRVTGYTTGVKLKPFDTDTGACADFVVKDAKA